MVAPKSAPPEIARRCWRAAAIKSGAPKSEQGGTPLFRARRAVRMKTLNIEVPDYAWIAIKMRAAQEMVSVRHVIMLALKADGIEIKDADMIEDGRRLRGSEAV